MSDVTTTEQLTDPSISGDPTPLVMHNSNGGNHLYAKALTWPVNRADTQVPNVGITESPATATFQGKVYCAHQGTANGEVWYVTFDGRTWSSDHKIPNVSMSASPALVVFRDKLFCFYQSNNHTGDLWYTTTADGTTWTSGIKVAGVGMSDSPTAIVFQNTLYVFHQGKGDSGKLYYTTTTDGLTWTASAQVENASLSYGPRAIVFNDGFLVMYRRSGNSGEVWYKTYTPKKKADGTIYYTWDDALKVPNITASVGPEPFLLPGLLAVFCTQGNTLNFTTYNLTAWSAPLPVSGMALTGRPSVVMALIPRI